MTQHATHGPYIVTTKRPIDAVDCGHPDAPKESLWTTARRAVATLAEARAAAAEIVESITSDDEPFFATAMLATPGTVGPLPDGTVIEVEPRQWYQLAEDVGWDFYRDAHRDEAELLAAYNAQAEGLMS